MNDDRLQLDLGTLHLKNPVVAGSSELTMTLPGVQRLLEAGVGAVVMKSVNESAEAHRQLQIADYRFLSDGRIPRTSSTVSLDDSLINRSGLASGNIDDWCELLERAVEIGLAHDAPVIGSVTMGRPEAVGSLVARISAVTAHVELNVGAPHAKEDVGGAVSATYDATELERIVADARAGCRGSLIIKLPEPGSARDAMISACINGGANIVTLHGRSNGFMPDLETLAPAMGSWGAFGSPSDLARTLYHVSKAYKSFSSEMRLCGTNGARSSEDIIRFLLSGASFVAMTTAFWINGPEYAGRLVGELKYFMDSRGISHVSDLIGISVGRAREYSEIVQGPDDAHRHWKQWG